MGWRYFSLPRFNIKTLNYNGYNLNLWDVGGQKSIRTYWRNYFELTDGIIWVVDSVDRWRLEGTCFENENILYVADYCYSQNASINLGICWAKKSSQERVYLYLQTNKILEVRYHFKTLLIFLNFPVRILGVATGRFLDARQKQEKVWYVGEI